jgi:hypothetical protein
MTDNTHVSLLRAETALTAETAVPQGKRHRGTMACRRCRPTPPRPLTPAEFALCPRHTFSLNTLIAG